MGFLWVGCPSLPLNGKALKGTPSNNTNQRPGLVLYGRPMEQGRPLYFCPVLSSFFFLA